MREFDLSDILSITDGRLVSTRHMDGVYDILNYMTGDNLFTHQLVRASEECKLPLLQQHPQLFGCGDDVYFEDAENVEKAVFDWVDAMKKKFGETLPVKPLSEWKHKDPVEELRELVSPDTPIVVMSEQEDYNSN